MTEQVPNRLSELIPPPNQLGSQPPGDQPTGPRGRLPRPTRRQAGGASGCGTAVVIIVWLAIQLGGAVFDVSSENDGSTPPASTDAYAAGQCLDVTTHDPEPGQEVETVDLVVLSSCAGPHDGEVFMVTEIPAATDGAYPRVVEFDQFADPTCGAAFSAYLGVPADAGFPFQWSFMFQWEEAWAAGDHAIVCYLERFDGAEWAGPARDAVVRASQTP